MTHLNLAGTLLISPAHPTPSAGCSGAGRCLFRIGRCALPILKGAQQVEVVAENFSYTSKTLESSQLIKNLGEEISVIVVKGGDELRYLNSIQAEAVFFTGKNASGTILIRDGASRSALVEEALHHAQRLHHGDDYFIRNRTSLEIEAQEILIRMAKNENWGLAEIERLKAARQAWIKRSSHER